MCAIHAWIYKAEMFAVDIKYTWGRDMAISTSQYRHRARWLEAISFRTLDCYARDLEEPGGATRNGARMLDDA
jgi:hypothetical protein